MKVARFPPLPPIPRPPRSPPDPRQRRFREIAGPLADSMAERGRVGVANTITGFPASAVDLGRLQEAVQRGVRRLDMRQVRERWKDDLFEWMRRTIGAWVQRWKLLQLRPRQKGIHIRIETQDDHGYYRYEFDVFPGREGRPFRSPKP